jgi:hypothetical protein
MQFECNQLHSEFTPRWVRALGGDRRSARRVGNSPGTHQRDLASGSSDITACPFAGSPIRRASDLLHAPSSGQHSPPGVRDHHPPNLDLPATCSHHARLGGRKPVSHEIGQHFCAEAVRQHDRVGVAMHRAGEQAERPALVWIHDPRGFESEGLRPRLGRREVTAATEMHTVKIRWGVETEAEI